MTQATATGIACTAVCRAPLASRLSCRSTSGCLTPWRARRRCRRSSMRPRWSRPACSSLPASTRSSGLARRRRAELIAWIGAITSAVRRDHCVRARRHQEGVGLLDGVQLGYMLLAVGTGAYVAAIFHMVTHAFFKALLFLGVRLGHPRDARRARHAQDGRARQAHADHGGTSSLAGLPSPVCRRSPASGRKTRSCLFALAESPALYVVGIVTAILTAFYMTRQVDHDFLRRAEVGLHANAEEAAHLEVDDAEASAAPEPVTHGAHGEFKPHESPPTMLLPLVVLAGLSMVGGIIQLPSLRLHSEEHATQAA